jgi:hypothetical protein
VRCTAFDARTATDPAALETWCAHLERLVSPSQGVAVLRSRLGELVRSH